jgi:hypothetical protein
MVEPSKPPAEDERCLPWGSDICGDSSQMQMEVHSQSPLKPSLLVFERSTGIPLASTQKRDFSEIETREKQYLRSYVHSRCVLDKAPDLLNTLKGSLIDLKIRAKMIDWMFEVLYALQSEFSLNTYLRAILVMDIYIKYSHVRQNNDDIHLIGLASVYIASKYEDIFHIKIGVLCEKAAPGIFHPRDIRRKEDEILNVLGFSVSFSSLADIADHFLIRLAQGEHEDFLHELRSTTLNFVIMCLHDVKFNNVPPHVFAVGCIINAIGYNQSARLRKRGPVFPMGTIDPRTSQEYSWVKVLVGLVEKVERKELDGIVRLIRDHLSTHDRKFPDCLQIFHFSKFQKSQLG